jgi:RNA polymerase sigma-70 factor (ECF subfamily)
VAADELQLVRRARRGDDEAFRTLMERYQRKVYAIAYGMVRNRDLAMDLCQDACIKVHRYLNSFQGNSSFYTWLYRLVVNRCIDYLRKEGKRDTVEYDDNRLRTMDEVEIDTAPKASEESPLQILDRKELAARISTALGALSEKHRAVIVLREVEGLSYGEIARVLKIRRGTVMSRLHHARKYLQHELSAYLKERGEGMPADADASLAIKEVRDLTGA